MPYSNPDEQRRFQRVRKRRQKVWFHELKASLSCERCGFSHPAAMQFHHRAQKSYDISRMINKCSNRDAILAEIAKCAVLCANCHAITHYEEDYKVKRDRSVEPPAMPLFEM